MPSLAATLKTHFFIRNSGRSFKLISARPQFADVRDNVTVQVRAEYVPDANVADAEYDNTTYATITSRRGAVPINKRCHKARIAVNIDAQAETADGSGHWGGLSGVWIEWEPAGE